jgi:hypothetical protein
MQFSVRMNHPGWLAKTSTTFATLVIHSGIVLLFGIHSYRNINHFAPPSLSRASFIQAFEAPHDIGIVFFNRSFVRVYCERK